MPLQVGDAAVTIVQELAMPTSARWLFPDAPDPFAILERARPWLEPHFLDADGHLVQSIQSYVVRTPGMLVVIDTGIGNDKHRPGGFAGWDMRSGPFLDDLRAAGCAPEEVDVVLNTHMHGDHVGWNTRLVDGRWVPTFPNARYVFARPEWEHWQREAERAEGSTRQLVEDSLQPVFDAGRVDLVPTDHRLADGLWFEPSPGHTPGHVNVRLSSRGADAVFVGDAFHSPIQCAAPGERPALDRPEAAGAAAATRRAILARYAGTDVLMLGAHFAPPSAGRVRVAGDAYRFDAVTSG